MKDCSIISAEPVLNNGISMEESFLPDLTWLYQFPCLLQSTLPSKIEAIWYRRRGFRDLQLLNHQEGFALMAQVIVFWLLNCINTRLDRRQNIYLGMSLDRDGQEYSGSYLYSLRLSNSLSIEGKTLRMLLGLSDHN